VTPQLLALAGVAIGSAVGGVARVVMVERVARLLGASLPLGTILVNVVGSFAIGVLAAIAAANPRLLGGTLMQQTLIAGVLGGFTTFSAFSLQTLLLAQEGRWADAAANVLLSVTLCLVAVWLGWQLASWLTSR
jgi:CrcB protein